MAATETQPVAAPSMSDLRAMAQRTNPIAPITKEAPEPQETEEENTEAEPGTAPVKQQEEEEFELPQGVQKRIAAEAKKAAFFQSKIDKAVSERKSKEAEAAKLTGKPGSEPDKTTEPAKEGRPKRPDLATFPGTLGEYNKAIEEYETKFEEWLKGETRATVTQELTTAQQEQVRKAAWDKATEDHGKDFPSLMDALRDSTPVGFQVAISALDDWANVAVHLSKNEDERDALVELFKANPARGAAELGKLEDRLKPATKASATEKEPVARRQTRSIAGGASGGAPKIDLNTASMSVFKGEVRRMRGDK